MLAPPGGWEFHLGEILDPPLCRVHHWRIQGGYEPHFHFHAVFSHENAKKNTLAHPFWELAPHRKDLPLKNKIK